MTEPQSAPLPLPVDFVKAVHRGAENAGWRFDTAENEVLIFRDRLGVQQQVSLRELFDRYGQEPAEQWPHQLMDYFRAAINLPGNTDDDLNVQAGRLLVRVGHLPPQIPAVSVWHRPLPQTNLAVTLALEEDRGLRLVRTDMVTMSGRSDQYWYQLGLENLRQRTPPGALQPLDAESGLLGCCVGDNYDGSRSLFVESLLPAPARHGLLASIPRRDSLLVLPLTRAALQQKSLMLLKNTTETQYANSQHKLSSAIYWVKSGVWHPLGVELESGGTAIKLRPGHLCAEAIRDVLASTDESR